MTNSPNIPKPGDDVSPTNITFFFYFKVSTIAFSPVFIIFRHISSNIIHFTPLSACFCSMYKLHEIIRWKIVGQNSIRNSCYRLAISRLNWIFFCSLAKRKKTYVSKVSQYTHTRAHTHTCNAGGIKQITLNWTFRPRWADRLGRIVTIYWKRTINEQWKRGNLVLINNWMAPVTSSDVEIAFKIRLFHHLFE